MSNNLRLTEESFLQSMDIAIENAKAQAQIAAALSKYKFGTDELDKGRVLLESAKQSFHNNSKETVESKNAYRLFSEKRELLHSEFVSYRNIAKVIFRKDPNIVDLLSLTGAIPEAYATWLEYVKRFYKNSLTNETVTAGFVDFGITTEALTQASENLTAVEDLRRDYMRERGESQDATKLKDESFQKAEEWLSDFFFVARIALADNLQLLESLGKVVKS